MVFARQIQGSGAASWEPTTVAKSAPDYSGIFETAGAVAGEVFSGMAVDDLLGSDEIPTTSVSNPQNPAQPAMISHTRGIPNIDELSGLRSIKAAREQGLVSGSRAQTLATKKLNEALNQYPQYRDQLLNAYDNLVDPLGTRAGGIFDATAEEEFMQEQAKQNAANQRKALEAGYSNYDEYVFSQQKMRLQAEEVARQDVKLQSQENIMKARGMELTNNIYKGSALIEAELGGFILEQVQQEGNLSPQTVQQLSMQITNAELQAKAKLAAFKANPQFDYDNNLSQLEGMYEGLRNLVNSESVQAKTTALLEQLKVASEADQWTRGPAVATLLAMGNSSGLDMIQALQRVTGDVQGNQTIRDQLEALVGDPQQAMKFKSLIEEGLSTADFNDQDMEFFTNTINSIKDVITDREDKQVMIERMSEIGIMQTEQVMNGTKPPPPIDEVVNGSVMTLADPKLKAHFETPKGKELASTYFNNSIATIEAQIRQDAMGSAWEIDANGNIVGSMLEFSPARSGAAWSGTTRSKKSFLSTQNTLVNKGLVKAAELHPYLLGEGISISQFKQALVARLNAVANPPKQEMSPEDKAKREAQGARNEERNAATRERLDDFKEGVDNFVRDVLPRKKQEGTPDEGATTIPLDGQPQAEGVDVQSAVDTIKQWEGYRDAAYLPTEDDVPTIGYGRTEGVALGDTSSREEEEAYLQDQVAKTASKLEKAVGPVWDRLAEHQKAAVVSLAYNVDKDIVGQFKNSKAFNALKNGDLDTFIFEAFDSEQGFVKQNGKVLDGLVNRRRDERRKFLYGDAFQLASN